MNESQFQHIFLKNSKEINSFLFFLSGDEGLAKDLTQDTFLKLWERKSKINLDSVTSLLYTIARNLYVDHYRKAQVRFKYWRAPQTTMDIQDPEYQIEYKEFHAQLMQAIEDLPEPVRVVFLMNRIEKFKYREIAVKLGISIKTVEKRMQKALIAMHALHKKI